MKKAAWSDRTGRLSCRRRPSLRVCCRPGDGLIDLGHGFLEGFILIVGREEGAVHLLQKTR